MMSRTVPLTLAVSFILGSLIIILGRGSGDWHVLVTLSSILAGACAWGIGVFSLESFGGQPRERKVAIPAICVMCVAQSCLLSLQVGAQLLRADVVQARVFCEQLRSELDRYKQENGRYPRRLSDLTLNASLPGLLDNAHAYEPSDDRYRFLLRGPYLEVTTFDSETAQWEGPYTPERD